MENYRPRLLFTEKGSPRGIQGDYLIEGHLDMGGSQILVGPYSRTESFDDRFRVAENLAIKIRKEGIDALILINEQLQRAAFIGDIATELRRKGFKIEVQEK